MRRINDRLLANYLRNYHQTHDLTPYVTETYRVVTTLPLTKKSFFYPGVCTLLQSVDQPEILLEQVFPATNSKLLSKLNHPGEVKKIADAQKSGLHEILELTHSETSSSFTNTSDFRKSDPDMASLEQFLIPGQEIKFEKPLDLSAILHLEKLSDGHLKFTTISLLYGSYGPTSNGPVLFSLAPPSQLNVEAGLPLLSEKESLAAANLPPQPSSSFTLQIISTKPLSPSKKLVLKNIPRAEKAGSNTTTASTKIATPAAPNIARALPLNTPAVLPAVPATLPATPTATPLPAATIPKALPTTESPSTAEATPTLATANQSFLPTPTTVAAPPGTLPRSTTDTDTLYEPGKMPRGRFVDPLQFSNLAEQGLAGERLYLQGDFAVTASGQDRSVLRYQSTSSSSLTPDRTAKIRIIVSYPPGASPPAEGVFVTRRQDNPLMITNVQKGNDGTLNVYAREITK